MSISPATFGAAAVTEQSSTRDVRSDHDHSPDEFAGLLAGAVNSPHRQPEPKKAAPEGTSELDRTDEAERDTADKTKRARGKHGAHGGKQIAATPDAIVQSVSALDPELQTKLASVMARMRDETGHNVEVAETFRSQARQDALFAQGRETAGPVVTWTQSSKHTQGRAVDVVLDNGTADLDAYATLQRIAGEEGLRTLGARDPGHLELPGSSTAPADVKGGADATSLMPVEPADASGPGQVSIARLAQVAQVTQLSVVPAQAAHVAQVAQVATPGMAARTMTVDAPQPPRAPHNGGTAPQAQTLRSIANDAEQAAKRFGGGASDHDSGSKGERGYSALAAAVALRDAPPATSGGDAVTAEPATTAADRAAKLIAALEDAPPRPLSQITMSVDAGNGTADRVQLAMRGSSLNATIDATDARAAQTMTTRSDELVRALSRDGIELEALRVRAAPGTATTQAAVAPHTTSDANTHSRFERGSAWQQQQQQQQQNRQRSQDERRQQQRNPRGGQTQ